MQIHPTDISMNILYLHSHDTGRYIQPYGYAVETPNMQRFAEQGVLFRNAFCAARNVQPRRLDFADLKPLLLAPPQNLVIRSDEKWVRPQ